MTIADQISVIQYISVVVITSVMMLNTFNDIKIRYYPWMYFQKDSYGPLYGSLYSMREILMATLGLKIREFDVEDACEAFDKIERSERRRVVEGRRSED